MKRIIIVFAVIGLMLSLLSCEKSINEVIRETSAATETVIETEKAVGGTKICEVHNNTFHYFPQFAIIEYVGQEEFDEWARSTGNVHEADGCPYSDNTLYRCIRHFDIPREVLESAYLSEPTVYYNCVWNFDVLYSEDESAADQYYRNREKLDEVIKKRQGVIVVKSKLMAEKQEEWNEKYDAKKAPGVSESVIELAKNLEVPREMLERIADEAKVALGTSYDYDFDAIYDENGNVRDYDKSKAPLELDAEFCGIGDIYTE